MLIVKYMSSCVLRASQLQYIHARCKKNKHPSPPIPPNKVTFFMNVVSYDVERGLNFPNYILQVWSSAVIKSWDGTIFWGGGGLPTSDIHVLAVKSRELALSWHAEASKRGGGGFGDIELESLLVVVPPFPHYRYNKVYT